ncbi:MAG: hypothetical protein OSB10_01585 [Planctomycetota bacterium]|nr:hypothetical protein [Planctomycetota bacterium]
MYDEIAKPNYRPMGGPAQAGEHFQIHSLGSLGKGQMAGLLGFCLIGQLLVLGQIEGYLIADSVEYMDRANAVVQGASLSSDTVRSFAFSAILMPFFWLANLLGLSGLWTLGLIRVAMLALGLGTIAIVAQTGARVGGTRAGILAGLVLGWNPAFLQYTGEPLTAVAAAFCMALAFSYSSREVLRTRDGATLGFWLGCGLMIAFKTIPIAGIFLLAALFRGRLRAPKYWLSAWLVFAAMTLSQCLLDGAIYGEFGSSLLPYVAQNFGGTLVYLFLRLSDFGLPYFHDMARVIYDAMNTSLEAEAAQTTAENVGALVRSKTSWNWYLRSLTSSFLAWPAAVALLFGAVFALKTKKRGALLLIVLILANGTLLSLKSSKSFRLWVPMLPFLALFAGLGFDALAQWITGAKGSRIRKVASGAALSISLLWLVFASYSALGNTNLRKYGAWWEATAKLEQEASKAGETWRIASAYNWAVRFRGSKHLEIVKLPHHMDRWAELDTEQRRLVLAELDKLDGFIAHLQILTQDPQIMKRVNARFEIEDILYKQRDFEEMNALYVLKKRSPERAPKRTFFELRRDVDPGTYQSQIQSSHSVDFRRRLPGGEVAQMVLLGWDLETGLASGEMSWLTLHWYAGPTGDHDYTMAYRLTDPDDRALSRTQAPAYGVWPTSALEPGWILQESIPIPVPPSPRDFGGANCRGDLIPSRLWIAIAEYEKLDDGTLKAGPGLAPFHATAQRPLSKRDSPKPYVSADGYRWSADGLLQIGGLWLPVPEGSTLPDDGRRLTRR